MSRIVAERPTSSMCPQQLIEFLHLDDCMESSAALLKPLSDLFQLSLTTSTFCPLGAGHVAQSFIFVQAPDAKECVDWLETSAVRLTRTKLPRSLRDHHLFPSTTKSPFSPKLTNLMTLRVFQFSHNSLQAHYHVRDLYRLFRRPRRKRQRAAPLHRPSYQC